MLSLNAFSASARGASDQLTKNLEQENAMLQTLEELTAQIDQTREQLETVRAQNEQISYQIKEAKRRLRALNERHRARLQSIRIRTKSLYKLSRGGFIRLLLDPVDGKQLVERLAAGKRILARDASEKRIYKKELLELTREAKRLEGDFLRQKGLAEELHNQEIALKEACQRQRSTLQFLLRNRQAQTQLNRAMTRQQRALLKNIQQLKEQIHHSSRFVRKKGRLAAPVRGPIVGIFGKGIDERHRVEVVRHGLTFKPPARGGVRAVASGTVRLVQRLKGYGNIVLLDHGDSYFTLYGYLSQIDVVEGDIIKQGTQIGTAGEDPLTGRSALYFEIRHNARPLDPALWIRRTNAERLQDHPQLMPSLDVNE
jgi:septal ring factor EnvC (AmiA/AmiB activator)